MRLDDYDEALREAARSLARDLEVLGVECQKLRDRNGTYSSFWDFLGTRAQQAQRAMETRLRDEGEGPAPIPGLRFIAGVTFGLSAAADEHLQDVGALTRDGDEADASSFYAEALLVAKELRRTDRSRAFASEIDDRFLRQILRTFFSYERPVSAADVLKFGEEPTNRYPEMRGRVLLLAELLEGIEVAEAFGGGE